MPEESEPRLKPEQIKSAEWMRIVGVIFAAGIFLLLIALVIMSVTGNLAGEIDRNTFFLLGIAFAIGMAMAAGFIGGSAAVSGGLGEYAKDKPIQVSAGGGIAVLIVSLILFFMFQPEEDTGKKSAIASIMLDGILENHAMFPTEELWVKFDNSSRVNLGKDLHIQVSEEVTQQSVSIIRHPRAAADPNATEASNENVVAAGPWECEVRVTYLSNVADDGAWDIIEDITPGKPFKIRFRTSEVPDESCLEFQNKQAQLIAVQNRVGVDPNAGKVYLAAPSEFAGGDDFRMPLQVDFALSDILVTKAHAQGATPYTQMRMGLQSRDTDVRIRTRRQLGANFDQFAEQALQDLLHNRAVQKNALVTNGLLHALTTGVASREPDLKPARGRSLDDKLPYDLEGSDLDALVRLSAHWDDGVRQQARRFMQRYPVNDVYQAVQRQLPQSGACTEDQKWIAYAAVFVTYNRMIQAGMNRERSAQDKQRLQTESKVTRDAAMLCLQGDQRLTDTALLDYGWSIYYQWAGDAGAAQTAARSFVRTIGDDKDQYYLQKHVSKMEALAR